MYGKKAKHSTTQTYKGENMTKLNANFFMVTAGAWSIILIVAYVLNLKHALLIASLLAVFNITYYTFKAFNITDNTITGIAKRQTELKIMLAKAKVSSDKLQTILDKKVRKKLNRK